MKAQEYKLGLVSVSFRQHSPKEILEATKNAGLSCIEWGSDIHAPCHDIARLHEIAALQKEYGMMCSSYGTYFRLGETPTDELKHYFEAAKILGTDIVRVWCGTKSGAECSEAEKKALFDQCKTAASMAEKAGVILCMECHKKTYTQRLEDALELMRTINSPCFRMYWQPFQWQSIEENAAYAKTIAPFTYHIHVFQWKDQEKYSLNEGIAEWRGYLSAFSAPRTLLLEFMPNGTIDELPAQAEALRTIVGENA